MAIKALLVILLLVLVFGKGKISDLMGDMAKGIRSFRKGLAEDDEDEAVAEKPAALQPPAPVATAMAEPARKDPV
ncbi:twin-arginine translocase TatA/TatE family subunit [Iodidimonas sp. SYSU 1G8]|uniref:twin-arginine translocase TatA/TatE family subunit n=1 Tax=Iodidimonas sp. SYSU 1G8 TaxID=3133967 RepID=UPI0031FE9BBC